MWLSKRGSLISPISFPMLNRAKCIDLRKPSVCLTYTAYFEKKGQCDAGWIGSRHRDLIQRLKSKWSRIERLRMLCRRSKALWRQKRSSVLEAIAKRRACYLSFWARRLTILTSFWRCRKWLSSASGLEAFAYYKHSLEREIGFLKARAKCASSAQA